MAFMGILLMFFLFAVPLTMIAVAFIFLLVFSFDVAVASTVTFIVLTVLGKFRQWRADMRKPVRYAGYVSFWLLIATMVVSYLCAAAMVALLLV